MRKVRKKKKAIVSFKTKLITGAIIVLCCAVVGFFMSPWGRPVIAFGKNVYDLTREKAHLVLDQVLVYGHARTGQDDINTALSLAQGMPIFDIDLDQVRDRLTALPWIKRVVVERHLPSTLFIRIEEKKPIAVWQNNKQYYPLDEEGNPIKDNRTILSNLLLVVGRDAPKHTPGLIRVLSGYQDIAIKVRSAVRVGGRRWNLILNDAEAGMEIYLPETDIGAALERLQRLNEESQILKRDLKVIDLRLPDRLIVRTQEGGAS